MTAVFLRILAWEIYIAKEQPTVGKVVTEQVQTAREDLGLEKLKGGAADDFIQKLRVQPTRFLSAKNTPPVPIGAAWKEAWRLLYLPPHKLVRQLSNLPVIEVELQTKTHTEVLLTLRDPAIPMLRIFAGTSMPPQGSLKQRRGLYFLGLGLEGIRSLAFTGQKTESLYIGKTDEFGVRLRHHIDSKSPLWWLFVTLEEDAQMFTLDALGAAEALLISLWNETSVLSNGQRGSDVKPAFMYLQQAIALVKAASATLLWFERESQYFMNNSPTIEIPFKLWRGQGWPNCYRSVP